MKHNLLLPKTLNYYGPVAYTPSSIPAPLNLTSNNTEDQSKTKNAASPSSLSISSVDHVGNLNSNNNNNNNNSINANTSSCTAIDQAENVNNKNNSISNIISKYTSSTKSSSNSSNNTTAKSEPAVKRRVHVQLSGMIMEVYDINNFNSHTVTMSEIRVVLSPHGNVRLVIPTIRVVEHFSESAMLESGGEDVTHKRSFSGNNKRNDDSKDDDERQEKNANILVEYNKGSTPHSNNTSSRSESKCDVNNPLSLSSSKTFSVPSSLSISSLDNSIGSNNNSNSNNIKKNKEQTCDCASEIPSSTISTPNNATNTHRCKAKSHTPPHNAIELIILVAEHTTKLRASNVYLTISSRGVGSLTNTLLSIEIPPEYEALPVDVLQQHVNNNNNNRSSYNDNDNKNEEVSFSRATPLTPFEQPLIDQDTVLYTNTNMNDNNYNNAVLLNTNDVGTCALVSPLATNEKNTIRTTSNSKDQSKLNNDNNTTSDSNVTESITPQHTTTPHMHDEQRLVEIQKRKKAENENKRPQDTFMLLLDGCRAFFVQEGVSVAEANVSTTKVEYSVYDDKSTKLSVTVNSLTMYDTYSARTRYPTIIEPYDESETSSNSSLGTSHGSNSSSDSDLSKACCEEAQNNACNTRSQPLPSSSSSSSSASVLASQKEKPFISYTLWIDAPTIATQDNIEIAAIANTNSDNADEVHYNTSVPTHPLTAHEQEHILPQALTYDRHMRCVIGGLSVVIIPDIVRVLVQIARETQLFMTQGNKEKAIGYMSDRANATVQRQHAHLTELDILIHRPKILFIESQLVEKGGIELYPGKLAVRSVLLGPHQKLIEGSTEEQRAERRALNLKKKFGKATVENVFYGNAQRRFVEDESEEEEEEEEESSSSTDDDDVMYQKDQYNNSHKQNTNTRVLADSEDSEDDGKASTDSGSVFSSLPQ